MRALDTDHVPDVSICVAWATMVACAPNTRRDTPGSINKDRDFILGQGEAVVGTVSCL
jgi:hypothetical protein